MYASVSAVVFIMERRVLTILMLFIIIRNCFAANGIEKQPQAAEEPSSKIQSCLKNIIEHIWNPSESLVFVVSSQPDYLPVYLPNPVTVVDTRIPFPTNYKWYEVNYIIEAKSSALFIQTLHRLLGSSLWHNMESPKGKFVILTKEEKKLTKIFTVMWQIISALHILVVIYDDTSKNRPTKIITCNPHMQENGCATAPTVFSNYTCDNISIEFLKPVRNYNKCPVIITPPYQSTPTAFDFGFMNDVLMWNILVHMDLMLNVTISYQTMSGIQFNEMCYQHDIVVLKHFFGKITRYDKSMIFMRRRFVWMGPEPKEMSRMEVLFWPFKYDIWLAVVFMTILFIFLRWAIVRSTGYNNHWNNLAGAFTDIIGLTFGVGINRIPNIVSLKIVIAFYLIYLIHIHTAYTSDLINVLVLPKYEGVIKSVEEVAESGIPIYMDYDHAFYYFKGDTHNNSLLSKISQLIRRLDFKNSSIDYSKVFTAIVEDAFVIDERTNKRSLESIPELKTNIFISNSLSGDIKYVFLLKNGSYFLKSLNSVLTFLYESGLYSRNFPVMYNKRFPMSHIILSVPMYNQYDSQSGMVNKTRHTKVNVKNDMYKNWQHPLGLQHLIAIFLIFIVCLGFCTIVFIAEIFIHKIY